MQGRTGCAIDEMRASPVPAAHGHLSGRVITTLSPTLYTT
jgi:hypothetical protein